jgi:hypothetical protein
MTAGLPEWSPSLRAPSFFPARASGTRELWVLGMQSELDDAAQ